MSTASSDLGHRHTILIVDDLPYNIDLLSSILNVDYKVKIAINGERAIKIVNGEHPPDLILLDIMMSIMDGYEVCRQIKANPERKLIPIIFVTAMEQHDDEEHGLTLGAADYITKPFSPVIVLARIKTHLALYDQTRELESRVKQRTVELEHYRQHLEDLVNERTVQLANRNEELQRVMGKLVQSEKLAALGHLVAGVAHELNTPLGNTLMTVSTMDDQLRQLDKELAAGKLNRKRFDDYLSQSRVALDLIHRSVRRAAELVSTFKKIAADQKSMKRHQFGVVDLIEQCLLQFRGEFEARSIQTLFEFESEFYLDSYPAALEQVLHNLLENTWVHAPIANQLLQVKLHLHSASTDNSGEHQVMRLVLSDNGRGIDPEILSRVFDPFFTTSLGQGGSGLGLYVVHNLVSGVLGGSISVESQVGAGSQFILLLPLSAPQTVTISVFDRAS
ncbi:MAG: response regulator [Undibacterium sp.]|nr:response regulator [Undibacterium sp.]